MFYCGGSDDRSSSSRKTWFRQRFLNRLNYEINVAQSDDLFLWKRLGTIFTAGVDGRDPMVLDEGNGSFIIYYTGAFFFFFQKNFVSLLLLFLFLPHHTNCEPNQSTIEDRGKARWVRNETHGTTSPPFYPSPLQARRQMLSKVTCTTSLSVAAISVLEICSRGATQRLFSTPDPGATPPEVWGRGFGSRVQVGARAWKKGSPFPRFSMPDIPL